MKGGRPAPLPHRCIDAADSTAVLAQDGVERHRGLAAALLSRHQQRLAPAQRRQGIQCLYALQALLRLPSRMSLLDAHVGISCSW